MVPAIQSTRSAGSPARFAKNQARTPTAWATFTASAVDIIAVSVSIDVFFSPLARRSRKVRTSNSSTASGTLCGIPLWASKCAEALATSSSSWAKSIIGKTVSKSKRRFSAVSSGTVITLSESIPNRQSCTSSGVRVISSKRTILPSRIPW